MTTKLLLFNKPFGVLSQFRRDDNNDYGTLADFFVDKSLRVVGRLDATSEGLLLLTNNGKLNHALSTPALPQHFSYGKTYWVQVAGIASDEQIYQLANGVALKDGMTLPAKVRRLDDHQLDRLWQAPDKVAYRKMTTWLAITLFEGKNRQIRRMTAHVGLPCLRLVRVALHRFEVWDLQVGEARKLIMDDRQVQVLIGRR